MTSDCVLVPLVDRKHLIEECVQLINEEWPVSHSARLRSVEGMANREPPMAFVLVDSSTEAVVGYARFMHVLNYDGRAVLFESVVIKKELRGRGFGRLLMDALKRRGHPTGLRTVDSLYR
ncbi:N-acetyltransferase domain-containing protein [Aphelenchoides fujianensis]|nr:N-acetyltransferase domain-containing protein [Aphelenchoides fujianensis]